MAKNFELIVFDWDGTLMDSAAAIVAAIQAAAVDLGLNPPDEERARHVIGLGLHEALRSSSGGLSPRSTSPVRISRALARASELDIPPIRQGIITFSRAVSSGIR